VSSFCCYNGSLADPDLIDYWTFSAEWGMIINVSLDFVISKTDASNKFYLDLWGPEEINGTGHKLLHSFNSGSKEGTHAFEFALGMGEDTNNSAEYKDKSFFLVFKADIGNRSVDYTFTVKLESQPEPVSDSPMDSSVIIIKAELIQGRLGDWDTVDAYSISVDSESTLVIKLNNVGTSKWGQILYTLYLDESALTKEKQVLNTGGKFDSSELTNGNYILMIYAQGSGDRKLPARYELALDLEGQGIPQPPPNFDNNDTDEDGLTDTWEQLHFGNLTQGPQEDFDGDGHTNLQEFTNETDPTDPKDPKDTKDDDPINALFILVPVAAILLILIIVIIVFIMMANKKNKQLDEEEDDEDKPKKKSVEEEADDIDWSDWDADEDEGDDDWYLKGDDESEKPKKKKGKKKKGKKGKKSTASKKKGKKRDRREPPPPDETNIHSKKKGRTPKKCPEYRTKTEKGDKFCMECGNRFV